MRELRSRISAAGNNRQTFLFDNISSRNRLPGYSRELAEAEFGIYRGNALDAQSMYIYIYIYTYTHVIYTLSVH